MIIKNGLVWEESGSFLTKDLHIAIIVLILCRLLIKMRR